MDAPDAGVGADDVEAPELGDPYRDRHAQPHEVADVGLLGHDPPVQRLDLGQDTAAVLAEAGLTPSEIDDLLPEATVTPR